MNTGWLFGRVGPAVEDLLVFAQELFLWEGVRERLRATADTVFPTGSSGLTAADLSPLRERFTLGP